jgi:hypothetical protein
MSHNPLIRTLYLYLFSLLGLILLTIGGIGFVNMGLRALIFTHADKERLLYEERMPVPRVLRSLEKLDDAGELTQDEKFRLKEMLNDYEFKEERRKKVNPVKARRHRDAAQNLAFIIIGLPIYLYHWSKVRSVAASAEAKREHS